MKGRIFMLLLLAGGLFLTQFTSCKKVNFLTQGGELGFSTDTLSFDTVFTTLGSVTHQLKIFNRNDRPIRINNIRIENGAQSFFRLNVDGIATKNISDVEIAANDSIYVFAALTVDPNNEANPFVIDDKILFQLNERDFSVALRAYGQNAHMITDSVLTTQTWINDLPYVITNWALVDSANTLTIQKGCRIYMHANSKLYVGGTLNCFGTKEDSITFQGDRLDRNYFGQDFPGEWQGLHFLSSSIGSSLNHTIIKNGGAADASVYVQPPWVPIPNGQYMLEMKKCRVANSLGYGILAFNTNVNLDNCLVHSCGKQNFAAAQGGIYKFNYCTFATYSGAGISHINEPVMLLLNYLDLSQTTYISADIDVEVKNCIIYGSLETELVLANKGTGLFNASFSNCIIRRADPFDASIISISNIFNQDPSFINRQEWDYSVSASSVAKTAGISIPSIIDDINDVARGAVPTIGCYE